MNLETEETLFMLARGVPNNVFDEKLYEDVEKLKMRQLPLQRKIKQFSGFLEDQKNRL